MRFGNVADHVTQKAALNILDPRALAFHTQ